MLQANEVPLNEGRVIKTMQISGHRGAYMCEYLLYEVLFDHFSSFFLVLVIRYKQSLLAQSFLTFF